jgi:SAM-dependent methyltransferase
MTTTRDVAGDYVLGTHDEEIERLGLQHRVWRPHASDAWRRAGFTTNQTLLDIGCGPGHATRDLAEIVGAGGRVVAVDRSVRFLDSLEALIRARELSNIDVHRVDLDSGPLPDVQADGAWCRWVFAFVQQPQSLLERIASVIKTGGVLVAHEYFDYATWRLSPRSLEHEEFVRHVMESWRATGGEPDIGLDLLSWLPQAGFRLRAARPIVDVATPDSYTWGWPKTFIEVGLRRLVDLGRVTPDRAAEILRAFAASEAAPNAHMITPGVMEIIAERV